MNKLAIAITLTVLFAFGCDVQQSQPSPQGTKIRIGDREIIAPEGHGVTIKGSDYTGSGIDKHEGNANGEGAGLSTKSEKVAQSFDAGSPLARLFNGSGADGGSTTITQTLTGGSRTSPLMWAGILAIVAGGLVFFLKLPIRAAFVCWGIGLVLIAASLVPAWAWIIVIFAIVGGGAAYLYSERDVKKNADALGAVAGGIEDLTDTPRQLAKASIAARAAKADTNVGKTIAKIKAKKGLPSERH